MSDLRSFQLAVAKVLIALGIVHVPILAAICALLGRDIVANSLACAALAIIPLLLFYAGRPVTTVAFGIAVTLVGQTSLLVLAFSGHPWQVEMPSTILRFSRCCPGFATGVSRAGRGPREPASLEP
jgi:hypothetical protein